MKQQIRARGRTVARLGGLALVFVVVTAQASASCAVPPADAEAPTPAESATEGSVAEPGASQAEPGSPPPAEEAAPAPERPPRARAAASEVGGHYIVLINSDWGQTTPVGDFTLHADGRFVDHWNEEEAAWRYDATSRRITFTGGAYDGPVVTFEPEIGARGALRIDYGSDAVLWAYREPPGQ